MKIIFSWIIIDYLYINFLIFRGQCFINNYWTINIKMHVIYKIYIKRYISYCAY